MRPLYAAGLSGLLWSVPVAFYALSETEPFPTSTFGIAVAVGPLIGITVYYGSLWVYPLAAGFRVVWAMITVLLAGMALLTVIHATGDFTEGAASWWVIGLPLLFIYSLFFPPAWFVYLFAYANHEWLRYLSGIKHDSDIVPV